MNLSEKIRRRWCKDTHPLRMAAKAPTEKCTVGRFQDWPAIYYDDLIVVIEEELNLVYKPEWLLHDNQYMSLEVMEYKSISEAVIFSLYLIEKNRDPFIIESMDIYQYRGKYEVTIEIRGSLEVYDIHGKGIFDTSDIPNGIPWSYEIVNPV